MKFPTPVRPYLLDIRCPVYAHAHARVYRLNVRPCKIKMKISHALLEYANTVRTKPLTAQIVFDCFSFSLAPSPRYNSLRQGRLVCGKFIRVAKNVSLPELARRVIEKIFKHPMSSVVFQYAGLIIRTNNCLFSFSRFSRTGIYFSGIATYCCIARFLVRCKTIFVDPEDPLLFRSEIARFCFFRFPSRRHITRKRKCRRAPFWIQYTRLLKRQSVLCPRHALYAVAGAKHS